MKNVQLSISGLRPRTAQTSNSATLRNTPCLLLTGSMESGGETSALDARADAHLSKAMDLKVILARMAAMLVPGVGRPWSILSRL